MTTTTQGWDGLEDGPLDFLSEPELWVTEEDGSPRLMLALHYHDNSDRLGQVNIVTAYMARKGNAICNACGRTFTIEYLCKGEAATVQQHAEDVLA